MIICPSCAAQGINAKTGCPHCGFAPAYIGGFLAWAPELAKRNDGFPEESFSTLANGEAGHFWFRARNALILWALGRYCPGFASLLEVGCGTGFVLSAIAQAFPEARISGSEIYTTGLAFAAQRALGAELMQMDARNLPYEAEFDVVAAFDVIEHIDEDERVLKNFYRAVKRGGHCLITVPQHQWLWSPVDEFACHKRRYGAQDLHAKMIAAGFHILCSTSFVTLLLPLMLASRVQTRRSREVGCGETLALAPALDRALAAVMGVERLAIQKGLSLPVGGSRLVVAQRAP
jgi:SAM-dependent methyltransferase